MAWVPGILSIILIMLIIYQVIQLSHEQAYNTEIERQNEELQKKQELLENEIQVRKRAIEESEERLSSIQNHIQEAEENQELLSKKAFENYCEILENKYKEYEEEYDMNTDALNTAYSNLQLKYIQDIDNLREELDKIQATRAAAIQAQLKEKEIKEKASFYCLNISDNDRDDIIVLERMKSKLHNPRILSMLIWQTYYQKPMNVLCANVLGTSTISGIYKITNQVNDMCYIGQSVDIATRFKQHAKCGLGIDTPPGNKLYKGMQEAGLFNFSFELLEKCNNSELNEKEKYYIDLYQSNLYGYNSVSAPKN